MSGRGPTARGSAVRISGSTVLVGGVLLLAVTLLAGLGRPWWIVGAVLLPVAGALLASAAWSASEARGDGNAVLLARSGAPLLVTIAACVVLLALPGWLLDRANDEVIAWSASDVVLVDRDLALTVEPAVDARATAIAATRGPNADPLPGVVVGRDPDDGRERWSTALRPSHTLPFDDDDPDGWHRIGDVAVVSSGGTGMAALDARTGRLLWQDTTVAPRIVLATTRTVASTRCAPLPVDADDDAEPRCTAEARDLRTGRIRWSAPTRDDGRSLGAPSTPPARDDGPWPSRWAVVDAPVADAPASGRAWTVREIDTGRVVSRGRTTVPGTTLTTLEGGVLRGDPVDRRGAVGITRLRLQEPERGVTTWSRNVEGIPADEGGAPAFSVAAPSHRIALKPTGGSLDGGVEPTTTSRPSISLVDPRLGRPLEVPVAPGARRVTPVRTSLPWLTEAAVSVGPGLARRLVVVDRDADLGMVLVPGSDAPPRTWPADGAGASEVTLAGPTMARRRINRFEDTTGEPVQNGIELRDADTARVVGRLRIDDPVWVRSEGDRIVVHRDDPDGDEDLVLVRRP